LARILELRAQAFPRPASGKSEGFLLPSRRWPVCPVFRTLRVALGRFRQGEETTEKGRRFPGFFGFFFRRVGNLALGRGKRRLPGSALVPYSESTPQTAASWGGATHAMVESPFYRAKVGEFLGAPCSRETACNPSWEDAALRLKPMVQFTCLIKDLQFIRVKLLRLAYEVEFR